MRKKTHGPALWGGLALGAALALLPGPGGMTARAETYYGGSDWSVVFTADAEMVSTFGMQDIDDVITGLQPGDNALIALTLRNDHPETTHWYMTNEVLYSLEDRSANSATYGGAYTYVLNYTNSAGEVTNLYSSDTVGGENSEEVNAEAGEGLHEATDSLEDFFYLDTLVSGQSGTITLEVALDGETQGNDYQDTLADLQMNFAVELSRTAPLTPSNTPPGEPPVESSIPPVKTGDESLPLPLLGALAGAGILCMALALYSLGRNGKEGES